MRGSFRTSLVYVLGASACCAALVAPAAAFALPPPPALQLTPPALQPPRSAKRCHVRDPALCLHALGSLVPFARVAVSPKKTLPMAGPRRPLRAPKRTEPAVVRDVSLGHGRALSLQLTPTPERCAPLVKLTF